MRYPSARPYWQHLPFACSRWGQQHKPSHSGHSTGPGRGTITRRSAHPTGLWAIPSHLAKNANARIQNMNSRPKAESQRQRAHTIDESRPKAESQRQRAPKSNESEPKAKSQEVAKGPLQIIISIADQRISVYDDGTLIARSSVSTGVQGHPTPIGVFSIIGKELWHRSNIYSAAPMPYMQRITWSGIALHAGVLPGHPASHGCIRLANDFAIRLWRLTKRGTRVIIARHDVHPVQIASPRLFSKPKTASSSQESSVDAFAGKDVLTLAISPAPLVPNTQSQGGTNLLPATGVRSAEKGRPDLSFCEPQIEQAFCTSGLYATV